MSPTRSRALFSGILVAGGLSLGGIAAAADQPAAPAAPALPPASGAMLANACTGCHGTDGVSRGPASPTIAGITKDYFVDTMKAFKEGKRAATIMDRIAKGYSDAEINAMATYFAGKKYVGHAQKTDAAKVAKGKTLHKQSCEKCHEEGGRLSDEGGILAGQWMPYLHFQMEDFTSGKTKMPEKMEKKVKALKPGDMDALIHFYGSQK